MAKGPSQAQQQLSAFTNRKKFSQPPITPARPGQFGPKPGGKKPAQPTTPAQAPAPANPLASAPTPGPVPAPLQMPQAALTPAQAQGKQAQQALTVATKVAKPAAQAGQQAAKTVSGNQAQLNTATRRLQAGPTPRQQAREFQEAQNIALQVSHSAQGTANALTSWLAALPTPGGIALMLFIILVFVWAIVPVNNGLTRAQLFYLTLTGKTALNPFADTSKSVSGYSFGASPGTVELASVIAGTPGGSFSPSNFNIGGLNGGVTSGVGGGSTGGVGGGVTGAPTPRTGGPQPATAFALPNFDFAPGLGPQAM